MTTQDTQSAVPIQKIPMGVRGGTRPGAGRKKKAGERYASGDLKPAHEPRESGISPAMVERMERALLERVADRDLATPLGWLRLHNCLTRAQTAAGMTYAELCDKLARAIGVPPGIKAQSFEPSTGRSESQGASTKGARRARDRHEVATMFAAGRNQKIRALLHNVCYLGNHPMAQDLPALSTALDKLERHCRLTGSWK